jgi:glycosyltransferase involved in cell wall biosynthesis
MNNVLELIDGGFIGGGQTHILSLSQNLDRSLFNPVIAANPEGEFKALAESLGFRFSGIVLPKFFRMKHLDGLIELVKEQRTKLIHSHGGVAGVYARMLKKHYPELKVIHTIHGIHYTNKNFLTRFLSLAMEQFLVKYTDRFICVSDNDFRKALKLKIINKDNTSVIKNGIDPDRFSKKEKNPELIKELGLSENDFLIGNISRFDYQKNQRLILTQAPEIIKAIPDARFLFAGSGEYMDECRYLAEVLEIKEKVIFAGEVKDTENYYPLFDIFVFPSLWEGLSITLIEAMASGCCILASDIPENRELIKDGVNGMLFSPGKRKDLVNKVTQLAESSGLCRILSTRALADAQEFNEKAMAEKIQEEYKKVLRAV